MKVKLKDLAWIFTLSTLGIAYVILSILSKVLIQYGGLAIIVGLLLALYTVKLCLGIL